MALLDWWAIAVAILALLGVSIVGGLAFGLGMSMDAVRTIDDPEAMDEAEVEDKVEDRLEDAIANPTAQLQLVALTFAGALIGGAIVALRAPAAPLANAAVVAVVAALANFIPVGGHVPRRLQLAGCVASVLGVMIAAAILR